MKSMQDKILDVIDAATPANLELVVQHDYSNTGYIYVQRGFDTILRLQYSFQTGYCTLHVKGEAVQASMSIIEELCGDRGTKHGSPHAVYDKECLSWHALDYDDGDRIRRMIQTWRQLCVWAEMKENAS